MTISRIDSNVHGLPIFFEGLPRNLCSQQPGTAAYATPGTSCYQFQANSVIGYLWIEYLLFEIHALKERHEKATTTQERVELQEQYYVVLDEYEFQLEGIETDEQRQFVMENLPFNRSD